MVKNRYDGLLRTGNRAIIDLNPANVTQRVIVAAELERLIAGIDKPAVLEIGCGEGELTKYLMERGTRFELDALDVSKEMLEVAEKNLAPHKERITFIGDDVLNYLGPARDLYHVIVSSWVIHNFPWEDKKKVFAATHKALRSPGYMMFMDKVYPDSRKEAKKLLDVQQNRYSYLPRDVKKAIVAHELKDYDERYRMDERQTIRALRDVGYVDIEIKDRTERDVVLIAKK